MAAGPAPLRPGPNEVDEVPFVPGLLSDRLRPPAQKNGRPSWVPPMSRYLSDGERLIDFVLAYDLDTQDDKGPFALPDEPSNRERRAVFEQVLRAMGLELEETFALHSRTGFVLVHAPFRLLLKQAEMLKIQKPVFQNDVRRTRQYESRPGRWRRCLASLRFMDFDRDVQRRVHMPSFFCQPFLEQHLDCFVGHQDPERFFTATERARCVYDMLLRARYDLYAVDRYRFGVERLVRNGTYTACYALHDEISYDKSVRHDPKTCSDRQLLYDVWVRFRNLCKYQPLHLIKDYFGTKIGFYFAWLGYYTRCLYPVALVGVLCVLYGVGTLDQDVPSRQICEDGRKNGSQSVLMCPICTEYCDFTPLNASCTYARLTHVFDNNVTILFAALMSIWATLFLEGWKRYHAELAYKWNVFDFQDEEEVLRPEFQLRQGQTKVNPVTNQVEPFIPRWEKLLRFTCSGVTFLFSLSLILAFVIGMVTYRLVVLHVFSSMDNKPFFRHNAYLLTSITSAVVNLFFILILNYFYYMLALRLTEWECPRTQTAFDNSYTLKVFLFQFINYYSSLFYIAFVKGRFSGPPDANHLSHRASQQQPDGPVFISSTVNLFGHRLEECDPAGCMVELVIQLIIIMCGQQFLESFVEILFPTLMNRIRQWRWKIPAASKKNLRVRRQNWLLIRAQPEGVALVEQDYCLSAVNEQFLFDEYLEMVMQFGFCTLFVSAFPLAPFFALLNNVLEIRLDAYKYTVAQRRPIPHAANGIGIWMPLLDVISKLAVVCNAFVIAFSSDFVPRLLHQLTHEGRLDSFLQASLSTFDARELYVRDSVHPNVTQCRYRDYRRPPCSLGLRDEEGQCDNFYSPSHKWWMLLSFKLLFVVVFILTVLAVKALVDYAIPDVPSKIRMQLQRERYLARQAVVQRSDPTPRPAPAGAAAASALRRDSDRSRGTDTDSLAYQGEDVIEAEGALRGRTLPLEKLRHMYANRRPPSLSSLHPPPPTDLLRREPGELADERAALLKAASAPHLPDLPPAGEAPLASSEDELAESGPPRFARSEPPFRS